MSLSVSISLFPLIAVSVGHARIMEAAPEGVDEIFL
jgi:hypothetical protein